MKKKKKTKTIIRNHVRIINTLMELDEKVFVDLFVVLYSYKTLREDFAQFFSRGVITEVNYQKFAAILIKDLEGKKGRFKKILDIIIS